VGGGWGEGYVHTGMPGMQENLEKEERKVDIVSGYGH
jgi:hypothetical protein